MKNIKSFEEFINEERTDYGVNLLAPAYDPIAYPSDKDHAVIKGGEGTMSDSEFYHKYNQNKKPTKYKGKVKPIKKFKEIKPVI